MIYVNVIGIAILAIFLLFILKRKKKETSDYLLITTIVLFAMMLISDILIQKELTANRFLLQLLSTSFLFPSFILYGLVLMQEEHRLLKQWWWIPSYALLFGAFLIADMLFLNDYSTPDRINALYRSPPLIYLVFYKAHYIFEIAVLIWFLKKMNSYSRNIRNFYSYIEQIHLRWFRNFTYVFLFLDILGFLLFLALDVGILSDIGTPYTIVYTAMVLSLFYLCYSGIRQYALADMGTLYSSAMSDMAPGTSATMDKQSRPTTKYQTSSLSEADMDRLYEQIDNLFERDQIYLEPQLKIGDLASRLEVTTHNISQTINTRANRSFYDYVNDFRVSHLKNLLKNPENHKYTILALGLESGFNSKASLNRVFRQYTGVSPKQYQKAHLSR